MESSFYLDKTNYQAFLNQTPFDKVYNSNLILRGSFFDILILLIQESSGNTSVEINFTDTEIRITPGTGNKLDLQRTTELLEHTAIDLKQLTKEAIKNNDTTLDCITLASAIKRLNGNIALGANKTIIILPSEITAI